MVTSATSVSYLSRTFTRGRGVPEVERAVIDVPASTRELTFTITNGSATGDFRVSAATVRLNGEVVQVPADFSQQFAGTTLVLPIGAQRPVVLEVLVQGAPESFLHIALLAGVPLSPAGGTLALAGGAVSVEAPAGAVTGTTQITAEPIAPEPAAGVLNVYDFGPDGSEFARPLTITLPYDLTTLPPGAEPALYWRRDANSVWEPLRNPRFDEAAGTATGEIDHFTQVGVLVSRIRVCPNSPQAMPTIEGAYPLVARSGRIQLCAGDHPAPSVIIEKGLTIEGVGANPSTIVTTLSDGIALNGRPGEGVLLRNVSVRGHTRYAVTVRSNGGPAELDGVRVENQNAGAMGILATASALAGSSTIVRNSVVSGGAIGIFSSANVSSGPVDMFDNSVTDVTVAGIQYQGRGANGTARGNRVAECGSFGCMLAQSVGIIRFENNVLTTTARPQLQNPSNPNAFGVVQGIFVDAVEATIIGNTVEGQGPIGDRLSPATYPLRDAGILVATTTMPGVATLSRNIISGGARGIQTVIATSSSLTVSGTDNVITRTRDALAVRRGSRLILRRSDITDYAGAVFLDANPLVPMTLQATDLACNWWGSAAGPAGAFGYATFPRNPVSPTFYQPVATTPIANQPNVSCTF